MSQIEQLGVENDNIDQQIMDAMMALEDGQANGDDPDDPEGAMRGADDDSDDDDDDKPGITLDELRSLIRTEVP